MKYIIIALFALFVFAFTTIPSKSVELNKSCEFVLDHLKDLKELIRLEGFAIKGEKAHDNMTLHIKSFTEDKDFFTEAYIFLSSTTDKSTYVGGVNKEGCLIWVNELQPEEKQVVELIFGLGQET